MNDLHEFKWTPERELAVELLAGLADIPVSEIIRQCKISQPTLWRWRQEPAFKERVAERRKQNADLLLEKADKRLDFCLDLVSDPRTLASAIRTAYQRAGAIQSGTNVTLNQDLRNAGNRPDPAPLSDEELRGGLNRIRALLEAVEESTGRSGMD